MPKKKTQEEIVAEVYDLVGEEYTVIGKYKATDVPFDMKHNLCGHVYPTTRRLFVWRDTRCQKCFARKKTQEQFVQEVYDKVENEYSVIGKYVNNKTKVDLKHNICGQVFPTTRNNFLNNSKGCPYCYGTPKKTQEQFEQEVLEIWGDEYKVASEYKTGMKKIKMFHKTCNDFFEVTPVNFLFSKSRCSNCYPSFKDLKKTTEQFKEEMFELIGNEYTFLSEYDTTHTEGLFRHNTCREKFKTTPNTFLYNKSRCPICCNSKKRTTDIFKKIVFKEVADEYTVLGDYITGRINIEMLHNICNKPYSVAPSSFLAGKRCPICCESKGEKAIAKWLDQHSILYNREEKFDNCKNINPLPFDFAVFLKNGSFILIEYQGIQHYKAIDYFSGEEGFKQRQINDAIKKKYCEKNDIPLLIIPYLDFKKIDEILTKELLSLELKKSLKKSEQISFAL